ncbi:VOC family protein [Nitratireductor luteus]|uniref:VOC family protein n=1 Tax=Nitratireductor luteus TaxID=2976980 RepID=UPI00223EDEAD|nr:VOC family protein [Nitratireductor luteus]
MTVLPFSATTPVSIGEVGLKARDADKLAAFYSAVVGLEILERDGGTIRLGAGGRPLLTIEEDRQARPDDPREAGLFHTAFLLPDRASLARWVRFAAARGVALEGASDHLVSEAVYLSDPEGNGIEIYADRDRDEWQWDGDHIAMTTLPLDHRALLSVLGDNDAGWRGAPEGTVVGHIHLRVGDPRAAEAWWNETLGLKTMARRSEAAVFLASGGYHHHVGANAWRSAGAGTRDPGRAGLAWVKLIDTAADGEKVLHDPWGTEVRVATA